MVDVGAYKEALSALNEKLPTVPDSVAAVAAQGDAFRAGVTAWLEACEGKQKQAEDMLQKLSEALTALGTLAATQAQQVHDTGEATEKAAHDWCEAIKEHETALETAVTGLSGSVDAFQAHVISTVGDLKTSHTEANSALDELDKAADEAGSAIDTAVDELKPACEALAAAVGTVGEAIAKEVGDLTAAMAKGVDEAETRIELSLEAMTAHQDEHSTALDAQKDLVEQGTDALEENYSGRIGKDVLDPLEEAAEGVGVLVKGLGEDAATMRDFSRAACQGFGERLTALQEAMAPLPGGVQNVAEAAQRVGLPWGG